MMPAYKISIESQSDSKKVDFIDLEKEPYI